MKVASLAISTALLCMGESRATPLQFQDDMPSFYQPKTSLSIKQLDIPDSASLVDSDTQREKARNFMMSALNVQDTNNFKVTNAVKDADGTLHWYCSPQVDGIQVVNAHANLNVDKFGRVTSMGDSWVSTRQLRRRDNEASATLPPATALINFAKAKNLDLDASKLVEKKQQDGTTLIEGCTICQGSVVASTKFYVTQENRLEKVVDLTIPVTNHYYNAFVSMATGKVVGFSDWTSSSVFSSPHMQHVLKERGHVEEEEAESEAELGGIFGTILDTIIGRPRGTNPSAPAPTPSTPSPAPQGNNNGQFAYNVVPVQSSGLSDGRAKLVNPQDADASPLGWHNRGRGDEPFTVGNNVLARQNSRNSRELPQSSDFNFDFPVDDVNERPPQYADASVTNMFVTMNALHDIYYKYGFDEKSGNFQLNNFNKGGRGGDAIVAFAQDGSGVNNANFATPPDGIPGRMRMFLFNSARNFRDGAFDNDVIIHESMHGVSNRLTGGPANSNCLQTPLAGGMGEGWSDFMSVAVTAKPGDTRDKDRPVGAYVTNTEEGIRRAPYSTNLQRNPLKYSDLQRRQNQQVHNIGEIWASMLFEVYWNMVDKLGFTDKIKDEATSGKGNTVMIQLVMDGLKRQPCNPDFVQARDAILEADRNNNNGAHQCEIIKGFAKRGLGIGAQGDQFVDSFDIPAECN